MLKIPKQSSGGQTAVEYLLLFGVVMAIVLVAFRTHLARIYPATNTYFYNRFIGNLYGDPSPCGDGICSPSEAAHYTCCKDCAGVAPC